LDDVHLRALKVLAVRLRQADEVDGALLDHVQRRPVVLGPML
jgi:hypothetical protein